jgi:8-amino-7-oxononanoate synthase
MLPQFSNHLKFYRKSPGGWKARSRFQTICVRELKNLGFNVWTSQTPIIPVVIGDMMNCFQFWKDLFEEGVYVNAVVPPAVPQGQALGANQLYGHPHR